MSWVKLDDAFLDHPKFHRIGPIATMLHIAAIAWCNRNLTDGVIPRFAPARLLTLHMVNEELDPEVVGKLDHLPAVNWTHLVSSLLDAGLWHERPDGDYEIHDYLDHQPSKEQVLAIRRGGRQRQARSRARHAVTDEDVTATSREGDGKVTDVSQASNGRSQPQPRTTPPNPPKGGRKRDHAIYEKRVTALAARLFPGREEAVFAVRGAMSQGAKSDEEIREWVARWQPETARP